MVSCKTGHPPEADKYVGNPVNVDTGNKYEEVLDLSVSTLGIPLEFRRSYNSQPTTTTLGPAITNGPRAMDGPIAMASTSR